MSEGMLGLLSLRDVRGPMADLWEKLASADGIRVLIELNKFLRNGCRMVIVSAGKFLVDRATPFNPATFIGAGWTIWKGPADGDGLSGDEEQDSQSLALTEIDWSTVTFEHTLREGETTITGEEKLRRLKELGHLRFDAKVGQDLMNEPGRITLAMLRARGIKWFDLPGTVLRSPDGHRCILYLYCDGVGQWDWRFFWLGRVWRRRSPSAVRASTSDSVAVP